MANIDYEKINKYLNDYCSEMDKSYFLENISDLYNLTLSLDFKLKTSVVTDRKARASLKEPTEYFTLQSTIQTAEMLIEARSVKEIAAIRTAATAKELPESGGLKGIAGYSDKLRIAEKHKPYTAPFLFKRRQLLKSLPSIRIGGQKLSQTL